jgi:hypothetical protein
MIDDWSLMTETEQQSHGDADMLGAILCQFL